MINAHGNIRLNTRLRVAACAVLVFFMPLAAGGRSVATPAEREAAAARAFEAVRHDPLGLRAFLERMPKGADLHNHATGAVYAETLIAIGSRDGACISTLTWVSSAPPCTGPSVEPLADAAKTSWDKIIDAWSTRDVAKEPVSGHDQFFATFARFDRIATPHLGEVIAAALRQAALDHVAYVELMVTFGSSSIPSLLRGVQDGSDLPALEAGIAANGLDRAVADAERQVADTDAKVRSTLGCDARPDALGCDVAYRYIQQVTRVLPPAAVFARTALAFALADASPRVVGLNFVAPEDDPVALRDYALHMRMIAFLHARHRRVHVALHAGELTLGLVPRDDLIDHIAQAVEVAGAERIGHGVDIIYERDHDRTLAEMRRRHILVEINLTSNDVILGVRGKQHPILRYLSAGVPIALSTDDEGISRIDLTHEYQRAVETYGFTYPQIERFVRNAAAYTFLPGRSLWADWDDRAMVPACAGSDPLRAPSSRCAAFLQTSAKAALQWRVERQLAAFEASFP